MPGAAHGKDWPRRPGHLRSRACDGETEGSHTWQQLELPLTQWRLNTPEMTPLKTLISLFAKLIKAITSSGSNNNKKMGKTWPSFKSMD